MYSVYADTYSTEKLFIRRIYAMSGFNRYVEPNQMTGIEPTFKSKESMCSIFPALESNWVILENIRDKVDINSYTVLLDINNSKWSGEDILNLRIARDYKVINYASPYEAPYKLKIEDIDLNCKTQDYLVKAEFAIDEIGFITDHKFYKEKTHTPLSAIKDKKNLLNLCQIKEIKHYKGVGKPTIAAKKARS